MTDAIDLSLPELPLKPRLRPGVTWALENDAMVVRGANRTHYVRGRHVGRLLVPLLSAMTGRADQTELAAAAACSEAVLHKALRQLDSIGVLEDLAGCEDIPDTPLSDWYARATADTGLHSSGRAVVRCLQNQVIRLIGNGGLHSRVGDLLTEHGLTVRTSAFGSPDTIDLDGTADLTVVIKPWAADPAELIALDDAMAVSGGRWLVVLESEDGAFLGPLLDRSLFPCLGCARRALPDRAGQEEPPAPENTDTLVERETRTDVVAAYVAAECLALMAGVGHPSTVRQIIGLGDVEDGITVRSVSPAADCRRCVSEGPVRDTPMASAHVYEYAVAGLPEDLHGGRAQYGHYTAANMLAQVPRRLCVDETALWSTDVREPAVIEHGPWARLSALLTETYGLRPGTLRRYPPTGGNIGSPRALVWLPESIWGSERAGLHSYEPQIDALCRLEVPHGAHDLLRASAGDTTCVLQVVDIEPLESKYGPRAPHIGRLDAGVTLEHLLMVCEARTITARLSSPVCAGEFFDAVPRLSRQLLLAGLVELPDIHTGSE
ncbi:MULTISPECIES: hypothetical protein [unclassified Streptomyces]|uniref:hypothetical protein n=1 Tax=unclassified Streptomyces TaxID=2593676 RepID=UPI002366599C|nr:MULTISPECIES: hypothetical protein [unclassified Streptomyces]MDF3139905.1 hypothetical protein [Streptomyces sp. T21Q-yed]WDF43994.1 hypothetical protein PBV52_48040 [Streptomyces sp. T12]